MCVCVHACGCAPGYLEAGELSASFTPCNLLQTSRRFLCPPVSPDQHWDYRHTPPCCCEILCGSKEPETHSCMPNTKSTYSLLQLCCGQRLSYLTIFYKISGNSFPKSEYQVSSWACQWLHYNLYWTLLLIIFLYFSLYFVFQKAQAKLLSINNSEMIGFMIFRVLFPLNLYVCGCFMYIVTL